jgi:hypothetical protein
MLVLALISNGMPAHATVDGLNPMPLLSAGTKLWLSATATVSNRCGVVGESLLGRSFSVRDRQGGTLLFGAATNQFDAPASPVQVGAGTPICTAEGINPDGCSPGSTVTYSSVILAGDTPVVARDSEAATVSLDGVAYDVRVTAQQRTGGTVTCADYCGFGGVALDVQATHLTDLIAGLEVGAPPACGQGNDPERDLFFGLYGVPLGSTYEGSVTYKGRYASDPTEYDFAAAGLVGTAGAPTGLEIGGAEQLLPEPAVGQSFWLSYPSFRTQALRVAEQGPLHDIEWTLGRPVRHQPGGSGSERDDRNHPDRRAELPRLGLGRRFPSDFDLSSELTVV